MIFKVTYLKRVGLGCLIVPFLKSLSTDIFPWEEPNLNGTPAESPETMGGEQKVQLATHEGLRDDGQDKADDKDKTKPMDAGKEVKEGEKEEATKSSEAEVKKHEEITVKNNDAGEKVEQEQTPVEKEGTKQAKQDRNTTNERTVRPRKCLPGPSWPLDSHPDRVKEYLVRWNMIGNAKPQPKITDVERPEGWNGPFEFVDPRVQAPQKPRGRKPKKGEKKSGEEEPEAPKKRQVAPKKAPGAKAKVKPTKKAPSGGGEKSEDGKEQVEKKRPAPSKHETVPEPNQETKKRAKTKGKAAHEEKGVEKSDQGNRGKDAAKKRKASQGEAGEQSGQDLAKVANGTPLTKDDKEKEDMLREKKARISRKSAAYHAARREALQQGMDALNAKELAKEVRNLGIQSSNLNFIPII